MDSILTENGRIVLDMEGQLERMREAALEERSGFERIINEMSEKIQQLEETETLLKEQEEYASFLDTSLYFSFLSVYVRYYLSSRKTKWWIKEMILLKTA